MEMSSGTAIVGVEGVEENVEGEAQEGEGCGKGQRKG